MISLGYKSKNTSVNYEAQIEKYLGYILEDLAFNHPFKVNTGRRYYERLDSSFVFLRQKLYNECV